MRVKLKKMHPDAALPTQSLGDVGFDLRSVEHVRILPNCVMKVGTGLVLADMDDCVQLHDHGASISVNKHSNDYYSYCDEAAGDKRSAETITVFPKIEGRSSLGAKGIFPIAGIIDPSYRGELVITLANLSGADYVIEAGDKVAQLVLYACMTTPELSFEETDEVIPTARGDKGFGSTGR